jgi:hypothetical protein
MIVMPAMPPEQTASWLGVLDLYDHLGKGWTLIGGQLVHLYCAERGQFPVRPTNDVDTVIDVRADPNMLRTFTSALTGIGFKSAGISAEGRQHRWVRGQASIDVLLPDGVGQRASERQGVTGSPTLPTAGGTLALQRSEVVAVTVGGREGSVWRPNLVGAVAVRADQAGDSEAMGRVLTDLAQDYPLGPRQRWLVGREHRHTLWAGPGGSPAARHPAPPDRAPPAGSQRRRQSGPALGPIIRQTRSNLVIRRPRWDAPGVSVRGTGHH